MFTVKTQGNGHKVAGTQEIYKRVAEICSKYGIEFEDKMLRRSTNFYGFGSWNFTPYENEYWNVGLTRYDTNSPGLWHGENINSETYGLLSESSFKLFDEVAEVLSATHTE